MDNAIAILTLLISRLESRTGGSLSLKREIAVGVAANAVILVATRLWGTWPKVVAVFNDPVTAIFFVCAVMGLIWFAWSYFRINYTVMIFRRESYTPPAVTRGERLRALAARIGWIAVSVAFIASCVLIIAGTVLSIRNQ